MSTLAPQLQDWAVPCLEIETDKNSKFYGDFKYRNCVMYGGRGSGKSTAIADILIFHAVSKRSIILCAREFQNSLEDSVFGLLSERIEFYKLSAIFKIIKNKIVNIKNGSKFIFYGVNRNPHSLKSMQSINFLWIEEGDMIKKSSWDLLTPTIRTKNSQIFISFNPRNKEDCLYQEFIAKEAKDRSYVKLVNWRDNYFWNHTLNEERVNYKKREDPALYMHIWEGEILENSECHIFRNKFIVDMFEIDYEQHAYYGLDFGYSVDPTACVRCYIKNNILYITHELYATHIEIDRIYERCVSVFPADFLTSKIRADSARPDTISFLKRQGLNIKGAEKGKGSVEDGIAYIRSFDKVIIHSNCVNTAKEFRLYSYAIDKRSGDVTTKIIDAYNHSIDALRYALEPCMKQRKANYDILGAL